ncbi:hypothetical protein TNCV_2986641 [Trichonephila clavipes]|nr:hypothetical protein TNCV_2986641 [Trichonephila clavipes]
MFARVRRPVRRKMVSWDYLWPTLRCRREAGLKACSSCQSIWSICLRVPEETPAGLVSAVPGFLPDDRHTLLVGLPWWVEAHQKEVFLYQIGSKLLCQGKGLVLPNLSPIDKLQPTSDFC